MRLLRKVSISACIGLPSSSLSVKAALFRSQLHQIGTSPDKMGPMNNLILLELDLNESLARDGGGGTSSERGGQHSVSGC